MKKNGKKQFDLSLSALTMPEFNGEEIRRDLRELEEGEKRYKEMYGDEWQKKYLHDLGFVSDEDFDYDRDMKRINEAIYYGVPIAVSGWGEGIKELYKKQEVRMHEIYDELYGKDYGIYHGHVEGDKQIIEWLINDAIKTGKWKELPDCLQDEYHKRVGDLNDK